jgi:hypothetical protein
MLLEQQALLALLEQQECRAIKEPLGQQEGQLELLVLVEPLGHKATPEGQLALEGLQA